MRRKVFVDGNGTECIGVEGVGTYYPLRHWNAAQRQIQELKDLLRDAVGLGLLTEAHDSSSDHKQLCKRVAEVLQDDPTDPQA